MTNTLEGLVPTGVWMTPLAGQITALVLFSVAIGGILFFRRRRRKNSE